MPLPSLPDDAQILEDPRIPLPFYRYEKEGFVYYRFDSSKSEPPVPLVMALAGLANVNRPGVVLEMINHKEPVALFPRIGDRFIVEEERLEDGRLRYLFTLNPEGRSDMDLESPGVCTG